MQLGRALTKSWPEALKMLTECKILETEMLLPHILRLRLRDPAGQSFVLQVAGIAGVGLTGNLIALNPGLVIECFEVQE